MVMARKGQGQSEALPKASFTRVAEDARETITGIDNKQALSYGCKSARAIIEPPNSYFHQLTMGSPFNGLNTTSDT